MNSNSEATLADAQKPPASRCLSYWRALLFSSLVLIAVLAWTPGSPLVIGTPSDKLNHLLAFSALGFLAWQAFPAQRVHAYWALLGFGLLIELVQWYLPTRSAELADLAADALGLALGAVLSRTLSGRVRKPLTQ